MAQLVKTELPEATEFDVYLDVDGSADRIQELPSDGVSVPVSLLDENAAAVELGVSLQSSEALPRVRPSSNDVQPAFRLNVKPSPSSDAHSSDVDDELEIDIDELETDMGTSSDEKLLDQTRPVVELGHSSYLNNGHITDSVLNFAKKSTPVTNIVSKSTVSPRRVVKIVATKSTTLRQSFKAVSNVAKKSTSKQPQTVSQAYNKSKPLGPENKVQHISSVPGKFSFILRDRSDDQIKCPECGVKIMQRSMRKHLKNIHNLFVRTCSKCKVSFTDLDMFSEHYAIHLQHEENLRSGIQSNPMRLFNFNFLNTTESASPEPKKISDKRPTPGTQSSGVLPKPLQSKVSQNHNTLTTSSPKKQQEPSTKPESSFSRFLSDTADRCPDKKKTSPFQPASSPKAKSLPTSRKRHASPSPAREVSPSLSSTSDSKESPKARCSSPVSLQHDSLSHSESNASLSSDLLEPKLSHVSALYSNNQKVTSRKGQTVFTSYEPTPDNRGICEVITVLVSRRYCEEVFTKQRTLTLCALTWLLGFFLCLPNRFIIPKDDAGYDHRMRLCAFGQNKTGAYSTWYTFVLLVLPSVLVGFSNGAIFCHWRRSRSRLTKWTKPKLVSSASCHHEAGSGSAPRSMASSPREDNKQRPPASCDGGSGAVSPELGELGGTSGVQVRVAKAENGVCVPDTASAPVLDNDKISDGVCKDGNLSEEREFSERILIDVPSATPVGLVRKDEAESSVYELNDGDPVVRVRVSRAKNGTGNDRIAFNVPSETPLGLNPTDRAKDSLYQMNDGESGNTSVRVSLSAAKNGVFKHTNGKLLNLPHTTIGNGPGVDLDRADKVQDALYPQNDDDDYVLKGDRGSPADSDSCIVDSDHELCHIDKHNDPSHRPHSDREPTNQRLVNGAPGLTGGTIVSRKHLKGNRLLHPPRIEAPHAKKHIPNRQTVDDNADSDDSSVTTLYLSRESLDSTDHREMRLSRERLNSTNRDTLESSKNISSANLSNDDQDSTAKESRRRRHFHTRHNQRLSASDISMIRSLLVVFVCCVILYMPLAVVAIVNIYTVNQLPADLVIWCLAWAFLNHGINWIVYGLMNRNFRKGYVRQLGRCCRKHSSKAK